MAIKQLHAGQYKAIEELIKLPGERKTIDEIAEICGVHRSTIFQWKKDDLFNKELKKQMAYHSLNRMPEVINAMVEAAVMDKNAAAAKLLLTANDMLANRVEINSPNNNQPGVDRDALQARLARLRGEDDGNGNEY